MDEINCIVCEKPIKFPPYIDPEDYDGQLFCNKCNLLWDIKLKSSKIIKYKLAKQQHEIEHERKETLLFMTPDGRRLTSRELLREKEVDKDDDKGEAPQGKGFTH